MIDNQDFKLGDLVVFDQKYYRNRARGYAQYMRCQVPPTNGVYIGWRTLSDGYTWTGPFHDMSSLEPPDVNPYEPKQFYKAALIVSHERKNPVYVPFDSILKHRWDIEESLND